VTQFQINLEQNEAATCMALVRFVSHPDITHLLIGVSKDLKINPRQANGGLIYTYKLNAPPEHPNQYWMELVHKTVLDEVPMAICAFQVNTYFFSLLNIRGYQCRVKLRLWLQVLYLFL